MSRALPPGAGEPPTKIVLEGVEPGSPAARQLVTENQGVISRFHGKARQQRMLSEQPGFKMHQALPGGDMLRYSYNGGQETLHIKLTPRGAPRPGQPVPPELLRKTPRLAIDVVFEPELYDQRLLYWTETRYGEGATPGDPTSWQALHFRLDWLDGRTGIYTRFPAAFAITNDTFIYRGDDDIIHSDGIFNYSSIGELVLWVKGQAEAYHTYDENPVPSYLVKVGLTYGDSDTSGSVQRYPFPSFGYPDTAAIAASAVDRLDADAALIYEFGRMTTTQPAGGAPVYVDQNVLTLVEVRYRPPLDVQIEDIHEHFDVLDLVAVIAGPTDKEPYQAGSPVFIPEVEEDERLAALKYDQTTIKVERTLDAHEARGGPGTFGAGFLAEMKHPPSGPAVEGVTFDVYVASTNSTARNMPPGPDHEPDIPGDDVTLGVDTSLRLRIRAREFPPVQLEGVGVRTTAGTKRTYSETPGSSQVVYDGAPLEGVDGGGGELGGDGSGGDASDQPAIAEWAFAVEKGWVDEGGEPSDPTAKHMGSLLADTGPQVRAVTGPPDAATRLYEMAEWTFTIPQMTRVAQITWTPAKTPIDVGSAKIELT